MAFQLFDCTTNIELNKILICVAEFLLDITLQIDFLVTLRDNLNAPITLVFRTAFPSDLILLTSRQFYEPKNHQKEPFGHSFTAQKISAIENELKLMNHERSLTRLSTDNHLRENLFEGPDKSLDKVGQSYPHIR